MNLPARAGMPALSFVLAIAATTGALRTTVSERGHYFDEGVWLEQ